MKILVDADSCPRVVRDLVLKRASKLGIQTIFAADRSIPGAQEGGAQMEICPTGDNAADDRIVELVEEGDLVLTRDIPLAKRLIEKGAVVFDDRGRTFTKDNINELLSLRNFMVDLADSGLGMARIANFGKKELKSFADSLDRLLAKLV